MNQLMQGLADVCSGRPLAEKWLLAPSMRAGHQWLEAVTRAGHALVNVRIKTLRLMAVELATSEMADRQVTLASERAGSVLVDQVFRRHREAGLAYLGQLQPGQRLAEAVHRSISALRLAGLAAEDIAASQFEVGAKGEELLSILHAYLSELGAQKLVDYAEALHMALARLRTDPAALPEDGLVLYPADLHLSILEKQLLEALPGDRRVCLTVDDLASPDVQPPEPQTDLGLLRWLPRLAVAPSPRGDGSVRFFCAVGEVNEVREVLRRCLASEIRLDDVEILHTDSETYAPLVYETMAALVPEGAAPADDLPVTLAEGLPCRYARPGRALAAWVAFVQDDYPQERLVNMVREGLMVVPGDEQVSFRRLAALLGGLGIGFGRDRYLRQIDAQIEALGRDGKSETKQDGADDGYRARRLAEYQVLRALVAAVLNACPSADADCAAILECADRFLANVARSVSKLDNFARERLVGEIADMQHWLANGEISGHETWQWLTGLPAETRVMGSGPRPGRLHVAAALSGGHSGRRHTFLVGLDDGRFPGAGSQDPLLLDAERRAISDDLPTSSRELEQKLRDSALLLARLRGSVTLSYPCRDLANDRDRFPSSLFVAAWRIISGNHEGAIEELLKALPRPASFAPPETLQAISRAEWWMSRLCGSEPMANAPKLVEQCFPHLGRGAEAARQRRSSRFTEYDGLVPEAADALDPTQAKRPPMSARRLELLGCCPRAFFFEYAMGLKALEELKLDPAVWLNPPVFGSLLHGAFERFLRELISAGRLPKFDVDWPRLLEIVEDRIASYRDQYPPPTENALHSQRRQLVEAARVFLTEEETFCAETGSRPMYLEASLGLPSQGEGTPLDCEEPIPIRLPDGTTIRVCGRVDRVDRLQGEAVESYAIWDYKTGSTYSFQNSKDPLNQGRVLQPAIYLAMVAHRLRKVASPDARVVQFGFFFPNIRERGTRIEYTDERLTGGTAVMSRLLKLVRDGAFPATNVDGDCRHCEYVTICGDPVAVAAGSNLKIANRENNMLQPFRELRGDG